MTLFLTFISEFTEVEAIVRTATLVDGRVAHQALVSRFEGTGALATDLIKAERTIRDLFYPGVKRPSMYWEKFEKELNHAYAILDRHYSRVVHSDDDKLRQLLNERVNADFLNTTVSVLKIELVKVPMNLSFEQAMTALRNEVNNYNRQSGVRGGRNSSTVASATIESVNPEGVKRKRTDSTFEKLTNGEVIEYHPSFKFGPKLQFFPPALRTRLTKERKAYKNELNKKQNTGNQNKNKNKRSIKKVRRQLKELADVVDLLRDSGGEANGSSNISTLNSNPMGGRNARQQQRNSDNRNNGNREELQSDIADRISALRSSISTMRVTINNVDANIPLQPLEYPPGTLAPNEADTNAETSVAGKNMIPIEFTTRSADVYGYLGDRDSPLKDVPIVTAATAYTCPQNGITYILIFNEVLWYGGRMDHSLINPNQLRHYGLGFWDNPYDPVRKLQIDTNDDLVIPLQAQGTKLYFESRVPTRQELSECARITMSSPEPWNPKEVHMKQVQTLNRMSS